MVNSKNVGSYALISVYDKRNISSLCKTLKKNKIKIISTGSTSKKIKELGYKCTEISKVTKFKEVLSGRVKTLHPNIYISILHDRLNPNHKNSFKILKFPRIDFVIVNLYPFSKSLINENNEAKIIEMIDIGGNTLLRGSAKNYKYVTTISSPNDYKLLDENLKKNGGVTSLDFRKLMSKKTFKLTYKYDEQIFNWFSNDNYKKAKLKYGENPDQKAFLYKSGKNNILDSQIYGKKISYNNILDVDSGLDFLKEFNEPTSVIIKHNNACGVASANSIENSFRLALNCDKKSAFGGVLLINRKIKEKLAKKIVENFFEIVVAPGFTLQSLKIFKNKKKIILIDNRKISKKNKYNLKSVRSGKLLQNNNNIKITKKNFNIISESKKLNEREFQDIIFAFKIVKHIKSNAIVLVKNKQTIGIGAGQMNRYDATKIAIMKYKENFTLSNYVCASDAFFPFVDSLKILVNNKCSCIVQPAGSINDNKIINYANKNKLKLVFSKTRVFKH
mgnify:CR=1 FL=1